MSEIRVRLVVQEWLAKYGKNDDKVFIAQQCSRLIPVSIRDLAEALIVVEGVSAAQPYDGRNADIVEWTQVAAKLQTDVEYGEDAMKAGGLDPEWGRWLHQFPFWISAKKTKDDPAFNPTDWNWESMVRKCMTRLRREYKETADFLAQCDRERKWRREDE